MCLSVSTFATLLPVFLCKLPVLGPVYFSHTRPEPISGQRSPCTRFASCPQKTSHQQLVSSFSPTPSLLHSTHPSFSFLRVLIEFFRIGEICISCPSLSLPLFFCRLPLDFFSSGKKSERTSHPSSFSCRLKVFRFLCKCLHLQVACALSTKQLFGEPKKLRTRTLPSSLL